MSVTTDKPNAREPRLHGQTVVVIGGSAGIGLETARYARAEGAEVVLTARSRERLEQVGLELGARSTAAFDAGDPPALQRFFEQLPTPIDHVLVSGGGPRYQPPLTMDPEEARAALSEHMLLALAVARNVAGRVTTWRHVAAHRWYRWPADPSWLRDRLGGDRGDASPNRGPGPRPRADPGQPDRARVRRHTSSASLLGDELDARRDELRATLPIGRVVGPADVAALAVELMINTAVTGATYDIDGGQQFVDVMSATKLQIGWRATSLRSGHRPLTGPSALTTTGPGRSIPRRR